MSQLHKSEQLAQRLHRQLTFLRLLQRPAALGTVSALLVLSGCALLDPVKVDSSPVPIDIAQTSPQIAQNFSNLLWSSRFDEGDWQQHWGTRKQKDWGLENIEVISDPTGKFSKVLRVKYPARSASPTVARKYRAPLGGAQFLADLNLAPRDTLRLSYSVRFSDNFDYIRGGKLPGLFGGDSKSGGDTPDGTDGFSTRFMWRKNGAGELYAYLPTSDKYGTSIGRGKWRFKPGVWHRLEQEVVLNQPGRKDGQVRVWLDGKQVLNQEGLTFRSTDKLKIDGIFFSTFFGGNDPSWATRKDVYVDFADFAVAAVN
uniref:polysaccharide lyase n=1 Tax=Trichocoleus desertorum TaxID=1481672 RepID=UPI0025B34694|nr:heparin lyase I family protein [Trichocoleus desertorum]